MVHKFKLLGRAGVRGSVASLRAKTKTLHPSRFFFQNLRTNNHINKKMAGKHPPFFYHKRLIIIRSPGIVFKTFYTVYADFRGKSIVIAVIRNPEMEYRTFFCFDYIFLSMTI